jgi:hypothetical protein
LKKKNIKLLEKNTMAKSFKEYLGLPTINIGGLDSYHPISSLGDLPPKGLGSRDSRLTGLQASKQSPFKKKILNKLSKPIKDYLKSKEKKEDGMTGPGIGTYNAIADISTRKLKKEDTNRIPRKSGQKAGSDKHSDLYTDENPKGTIHGLGFTDAETARTSVNKIKSSGKTHAHKIQAAIAMSQRAKVASERAKDPKKKKDLGAAHKVYQSFIDTNKKKD